MNMEAATLLEELRSELRGMASPWLTRQGAADYLHTDVSEIDRLRGMGKLPVSYFSASPRYKRSDLDKLITDKKESYRK